MDTVCVVLECSSSYFFVNVGGKLGLLVGTFLASPRAPELICGISEVV